MQWVKETTQPKRRVPRSKKDKKMRTYTMIFGLAEDKRDFMDEVNRMKFVESVKELDARSIEITFRSGTKYDRIRNLCDSWAATIC